MLWQAPSIGEALDCTLKAFSGVALKKGLELNFKQKQAGLMPKFWKKTNFEPKIFYQIRSLNPLKLSIKSELRTFKLDSTQHVTKLEWTPKIPTNLRVVLQHLNILSATSFDSSLQNMFPLTFFLQKQILFSSHNEGYLLFWKQIWLLWTLNLPLLYRQI